MIYVLLKITPISVGVSENKIYIGTSNVFSVVGICFILGKRFIKSLFEKRKIYL